MINVINIIPAPDLVDNFPIAKISVLIDVIRFTTTMTTALSYGAQFIETYSDIETPKLLKQQGYLAAGERNAKKLEGYDFGNSPLEFCTNKIKNQKIAFSTTNGTYAQEKISKSEYVLAGGFINIDALFTKIQQIDGNVNLMCSGRHLKPCVEDTIFAGALAEKLLNTQKYTFTDDNVSMAISLYKIAKSQGILQFCLDHSPYLLSHYSTLKADIDYVFQENITKTIPLQTETNKFIFTTL
ncbi:MAG: 2-phosphosulfolactate phosphatase [Bacteroidales bacterium]|nr:2-phosphosulfolactate phosphatase [Bacteroidales bacterium]